MIDYKPKLLGFLVMDFEVFVYLFLVWDALFRVKKMLVFSHRMLGISVEKVEEI